VVHACLVHRPVELMRPTVYGYLPGERLVALDVDGLGELVLGGLRQRETWSSRITHDSRHKAPIFPPFWWSHSMFMALLPYGTYSSYLARYSR
jgi:hypothetical protein